MKESLKDLITRYSGSGRAGAYSADFRLSPPLRRAGFRVTPFARPKKGRSRVAMCQGPNPVEFSAQGAPNAKRTTQSFKMPAANHAPGCPLAKLRIRSIGLTQGLGCVRSSTPRISKLPFASSTAGAELWAKPPLPPLRTIACRHIFDGAAGSDAVASRQQQARALGRDLTVVLHLDLEPADDPRPAIRGSHGECDRLPLCCSFH